MRAVLFKIGLVVGVALAEAPFAERAAALASPPCQSEWRAYQSGIQDAATRCDFARAETIARKALARCSTSLGNRHPDTMHVAAAAKEYRLLRDSADKTKLQYATSMASRVRLWQEVEKRTGDSLPSSHSLTDLMKSFRDCSHRISPTMPSASLADGDSIAGIARICALARVFEGARPLAISAHHTLLSAPGVDIQTKSVELMTAEILRELDSEPHTRVKLLNGVIEFTEQFEITDRMLWWRERATTLSAEHYCVQGNRQEADRLYAEVRSRLPEDSDHDLVGWCKSWCDRHEARQLMEKGDWDAAYEKIFQARVGTIDYGHRNLSKGLTMERILRMSAEIQRKRGNDKEADEDQEYADLIARHAAKLRTAVEAELKKLREPEANTAPQPLPAP